MIAHRLLFALMALTLLVTPAAAQKRPLQLTDMSSLQNVSDPQLSPDGATIAVATIHQQTYRDHEEYAHPVTTSESHPLFGMAWTNQIPTVMPVALRKTTSLSWAGEAHLRSLDNGLYGVLASGSHVAKRARHEPSTHRHLDYWSSTLSAGVD